MIQRLATTGLALILALAGCEKEKYQPAIKKSQNNSITSINYTQKLEEILRTNGITPIVKNNGSNRTLLTIAENHSAIPVSEYSSFFNNINKKVKISAIFLEGVYRPGKYNDPLRDYFKELDILRELPENQIKCDNLQIKEKYAELKKDFLVYGIEDRVSFDCDLIGDIWFDLNSSLYKPQNHFKKDKNVENRINRLISRLKNVKLESINLPEEYGSKEYKDYQEKIDKLQIELVVDRRNKAFIEVINQYLKHREVGAIIVGRAHVFEEGMSKNRGTIQEGLDSAKINQVIIHNTQIPDFNKRFNLK